MLSFSGACLLFTFFIVCLISSTVISAFNGSEFSKFLLSLGYFIVELCFFCDNSLQCLLKSCIGSKTSSLNCLSILLPFIKRFQKSSFCNSLCSNFLFFFASTSILTFYFKKLFPLIRFIWSFTELCSLSQSLQIRS